MRQVYLVNVLLEDGNWYYIGKHSLDPSINQTILYVRVEKDAYQFNDLPDIRTKLSGDPELKDMLCRIEEYFTF